MAELSSTYLRGSANLRAYYKLENTNDELGNYNLTNVGGATIVAGKYGNAVQADSSGKYYTIANDLGGLASGTLSFAFWIKLVDNAGQYYTMELSDNSTRLRYQIRYGANAISFSRVREGVGVTTATGAVTTDITKFHHIVATYNSADGAMALYHDNILIATNSNSGNGTSGGSEEFVVGGVTGDGFANSIIDDIGMFNKVLTEGDRSVLFNESGGSFLYNLL